MKSLQVIRTHFSPYHGSNFEQIERDRLQKIPGISMVPITQADHSLPSVLITNTSTELKKLPNTLLKNTQLILHSNSGYENFTSDVELWSSIPLLIGHSIRAQAVAEYSLACVFQGLLEIPQHLTWDKNRHWERPLIKDQQIWVFGNGHIGKIIITTLKALGAQVTVVDPFLNQVPSTDHSEARIIIAATSSNQSNYHLFNESFFKLAHPELIFINGARGKLVEEKALREFLLSHPKAQAFLDVFEQEPFDQSWHHFPQVWKTSHIAGVYSGLDEGIIQFEERALTDYTQMSDIEFKQKYQHELLQNKWIKGELI